MDHHLRTSDLHHINWLHNLYILYHMIKLFVTIINFYAEIKARFLEFWNQNFQKNFMPASILGCFNTSHNKMIPEFLLSLSRACTITSQKPPWDKWKHSSNPFIKVNWRNWCVKNVNPKTYFKDLWTTNTKYFESSRVNVI